MVSYLLLYDRIFLERRHGFGVFYLYIGITSFWLYRITGFYILQDGVFHKDKIALVMDHFVPNKDIKSAEHCKCVREFACKHEISNYFDVGEMGIEHALLPEKG